MSPGKSSTLSSCAYILHTRLIAGYAAPFQQFNSSFQFNSVRTARCQIKQNKNAHRTRHGAEKIHTHIHVMRRCSNTKEATYVIKTNNTQQQRERHTAREENDAAPTMPSPWCHLFSSCQWQLSDLLAPCLAFDTTVVNVTVLPDTFRFLKAYIKDPI